MQFPARSVKGRNYIWLIDTPFLELAQVELLRTVFIALGDHGLGFGEKHMNYQQRVFHTVNNC